MAVIMLGLLLALCTLATPVLSDSFEYFHNGEDWTGICATGTSQSPIDIVDSTEVDNGDGYSPLSTTYVAVSNFDSDVEGHNYKLIGGFGTLTAVDVAKTGNYTYAAIQFHFHAPSEHKLDGVEFALEVHIVHALVPSSAVNPLNYAVLSVLFTEGEENAFLANILSSDPTSIDLSTLLGTTTVDSYYMYKGSLTTPPCTEAVNWYVSGTIFTASAAQIKAFNDHWELNPSFAGGKGNNREVQNLNGRAVFHYNDIAAALSVLGLLLGLSLFA
jgi:carbonic anhydrase